MLYPAAAYAYHLGDFSLFKAVADPTFFFGVADNGIDAERQGFIFTQIVVERSRLLRYSGKTRRLIGYQAALPVGRAA